MKLNNPFNNYDENNILQFFGVFLLSIYPITFFFGSAVLNASVVLLDIIFIAEKIEYNDEFFLFKEYLTSISQIAVLLYYVQFIYLRFN